MVSLLDMACLQNDRSSDLSGAAKSFAHKGLKKDVMPSKSIFTILHFREIKALVNLVLTVQSSQGDGVT